MPALFALAARALPTSRACSIFEPGFPRNAVQRADASVRPVSSSTSWANMPRFERKTTSRGRSAVPEILPRTRRCRRRRACRFVITLTGPSPARERGGLWGTGRLPTSSKEGGCAGGTWFPPRTRARGERSSCAFAHLSPHLLVDVADPLALVGLRRPHLADLRCRLSHHLLVDALDDDLGRRRHLEGDALARPHRYRVRVAHRELEVGALELGAVADAVDLQPLLEAFRNAVDHVRDQRPREAVKRTVVAALGRTGHDDLVLELLDLHACRHRLGQLAERPVHLHAPRGERDENAGRELDGLAADSRHRYQTKAITSPPTPRSAAWRPVMTPLEVDMIAVPRPPRTRGSRSFCAYTRRPGLDTRFTSVMTRRRSFANLSSTTSSRYGNGFPCSSFASTTR